MWTAIKSALSIFNTFLTNSRDSELKADGARKAELESRDKQDEISNDAKKHRKVNNSATVGDITKRL